MIAKNKKGKSFGGTVRYVLNEGHEVLEAEGVLAEDAASIIRDFAIQRSGRPEIKQPVGHIAIAFSPEDSPRMTNEFLLQLADEYKREMGIVGTQYIIVRHHNTEHPHIHIVYNRIDNDLKLISVNNDYKRNIKVCKKLKNKYGLTYGKGKEKVNRQKLTGPDKVKYQIHDEIAANLPKCRTYEELETRLRQAGITVRYKYLSGAEELPENIQGVSFEKNKTAFKGSEIDRKFSHANLKKVMGENMYEILKQIMAPTVAPEKPQTASSETRQPTPQTPASEPPRATKQMPVIFGIEITPEQNKTLRDGGYIYLENMKKEDGNGKFSAFVFLNDEKTRVFTSNENPDKMVEYGGITIRVRDKRLVEKGHITKAKMKWWGGIDYQYPFVWKDPQSNEVKHSFADPRIPKEVHEKELAEFRQKIRQRIPPKKNNGTKIR